MTTVEILREARALIEKGWTQGEHATDAHGVCVGPLSDAACHWCIEGALLRARKGWGFSSAWFALIDVIPSGNPIGWNDAEGRTQAEVLAAFDKAILLADGATAPNASSETASSQGENQ